LVGVAVNVSEEPAQVGLVPNVIAIDTEGTSTGFTVIVIPVLVAVVGLAQVAFDVKTQVTICPLVKVVVVKVTELVPAFTPFTFH
jgi:hypothetical protein